MKAVKILIIDDERHITRFLEFILQKEDYQIAMANDGVEGLKTFREFQPHAVILDLGLPDMNGLEVLKQIRASDKSATTKVIVLTATLKDETNIELNRLGIDARFSKPIAPTMLLNTLQNFNLK